MTQNTISPKYCLYARKSSESDERQAMSIDSQIKEMTALAEKEGIEIVDIKQESHSAKISGSRPLFLEMIKELNYGKYNAILTWAPDRLSRNAGDLGSLVDLMDRVKLLHIRTISQSFSNNPNEKFLLMILCSQAKLENDNRGLNVKRGIRTKCEMGWRPCPAPIGYINYSHGGTKKVMVNKEVAPLVKELFDLVATKKYSGRDIKKYLDKDGRLNKATGKKIPLSMIYRMLKTPFYYGEFQYPEGDGPWYKGAHEPIIPKWLFDKVQQKLVVPRKSKWGAKDFLFKNVFRCAYCGATIVGEEKFKMLKVGQKRTYIYYHCTKQVDAECPEMYVAENILIGSLISYIQLIEVKKPDTLQLTNEVKKSMRKFSGLRAHLLTEQNVTLPAELTFTEYLKYIIYNGTDTEKHEVIESLPKPLYIHNGTIYSHPLG
ncbi:MAG: recombinase family protein [Patescibacteria group bacterium]